MAKQGSDRMAAQPSTRAVDRVSIVHGPSLDDRSGRSRVLGGLRCDLVFVHVGRCGPRVGDAPPGILDSAFDRPLDLALLVLPAPSLGHCPGGGVAGHWAVVEPSLGHRHARRRRPLLREGLGKGPLSRMGGHVAVRSTLPGPDDVRGASRCDEALRSDPSRSRPSLVESAFPGIALRRGARSCWPILRRHSNQRWVSIIRPQAARMGFAGSQPSPRPRAVPAAPPDQGARRRLSSPSRALLRLPQTAPPRVAPWRAPQRTSTCSPSQATRERSSLVCG